MIDNPSLTPLDESPDLQHPDIELPISVAIPVPEREVVLTRAPSPADCAEGGELVRPRRKCRKEQISLSHHAARCSICNHPDREAIEQGFMHWESPTLLAHEYGLGRRRAVYRHARALGLFKKRAARYRHSLEFVMERAETVKPTADSVIRAVRAYSCLGEDGRWTEPTRRVIITHEYVGLMPADAAALGDQVNSTGIPRLTTPALAKTTPALLRPQRTGDYRSAPGVSSLATNRSLALSSQQRSEGPLATVSPTLADGHAGPSKNAVTLAPPTKVQKLMGTLFNRFGGGFSTEKT